MPDYVFDNNSTSAGTDTVYTLPSNTTIEYTIVEEPINYGRWIVHPSKNREKEEDPEDIWTGEMTI